MVLNLKKINPRGARLPKHPGRCQAFILAIALVGASAHASERLLEKRGLRDCIESAGNAGAIAACEAQEQASLRDRIERWSRSIRALLDNRQRPAFDRSAAAWQAWFEAETELLDLTLGQRRDGLGPKLRSGAITRLFEERERQLREHLHNLKFAGGRQ
jgi:hypothetical protein